MFVIAACYRRYMVLHQGDTTKSTDILNSPAPSEWALIYADWYYSINTQRLAFWIVENGDS